MVHRWLAALSVYDFMWYTVLLPQFLLPRKRRELGRQSIHRNLFPIGSMPISVECK